MSDHVSAVNHLTAAWARRVTDESAVLSGTGLWPLLAILAASADEPGRTELSAAIGIPAAEGMEAARTVLDALTGAVDVDAALGLWARPEAQVSAAWREQLAPDTFGQLSGDAGEDRAMLDRWARERTGGLIEEFPVEISPEILLTLATALAMRTTWERAFTDEPIVPPSGPWQGRRLAGLRRQSLAVDDLRVATTPAGEVTLNRVAGDNGLDVHLVIGEEGRGAAELLPAAVEALDGAHPVRTGSTLLAQAGGPQAPGVSTIPAQREGLATTTVRFTVRSEHDLLKLADVFGLRTVTQSDKGHFPAIGPVPLMLSEARQSAVAMFSSTGFEAAAVTAIGMRAVSMPVHRARALAVTYDRPFGFVAVHRESALVLFAGWVDTPEPWSTLR